MRIPTWFVMVWVVVAGLLAVGGSALAYTLARDNFGELDEVLELPDPPQIGRPFSLTGAEATPVTQPDTAPEPGMAPADATDADDSSDTDGADASSDDSTPPPDVSTDPAGDDGAPAGPGNTDTDTDTNTDADTDADAEYVPYQDPRRVNVLLLGIDQREGETGPFPTDTIILFSLDPVGQTAAILSIPRDLWIEMPALGRPARINSANILGDERNYPGGGGPVLAMRAVERVLGIEEIDFYVLINFEVFYAVVDAIGPIEVCPETEIHDDQYPDGSYGYITVHFDPGCQELESERLLQYARTRHADSDIGRSARQQEVILSVRDKVLSAGGVMALVPEALNIWQSIQDNVRTNMSFDDMVSLALRAEQVAPDNIRPGQLSFGEVHMSEADDGSQILIPISTDIQMLLDDLFRPANTPSQREAAGTP